MASEQRELLSRDDAQILRLESDAIKGHTGKVMVLGPDANGSALSVPRLRERVGERIGGFPRLSQRVEEPRFGLRRPAWMPAPEIDLGWHLAEPASHTLNDDELRLRVGDILAERLDHRRPLWRIDALPMDGERTALVARLHHAMADGISAIRLVSGILFDTPGAPPPTGSAPAKPAAAGIRKSAAAGQASEADEARIIVRLPSALWRELRPGTDTSLDHHIGPKREVAWQRFPLKRLKEIGKRAGDGVTVNDAILAVVAGGLRGWLQDRSPDRLRVQCPVSLHAREEDVHDLGNRDSFMNVDLPIALEDPIERLRFINAETRERKLDHDAETLYAFFHALGRFRPLYKGVTRLTSGPREFALSVSNVPGPRESSAILGHEVEQFASFAEPADRHALRIAVISLAGDLAFGLCSDPDAIDGLGDLRDALADSVSELERAVA